MQFIVPKPTDTTAQWRLVKISDKVAIVQQSQALSFDNIYGNACVKWTDIPPTELLRVISSKKFQIYTGLLAGLLAERRQELMRILLTTFWLNARMEHLKQFQSITGTVLLPI